MCIEPGLSAWESVRLRLRSAQISASFHHDSRGDNLISDMTQDTTRKTSFKPTSRRSSHPRADQDGPAKAERLSETGRVPLSICPGCTSFRHPQLTAVLFDGIVAEIAAEG
jgi:hypothetical protein